MSDVTTEFAEAMLVLAEATGARLTEHRIRTYFALLSDVGIEDFRKAAYRCARERDQKFLPADLDARLPTVAEIRSYLVASESDAALVAWSGLQRAAADVGAYASLDVEDGAAAVALVQVFGGWPEFCQLTDIAMATRKAEFLAVYRQLRRILHAPKRLAGLCAGGSERSWVGRLLASGAVEHVRDQALLEAAPEQKRLTD